MYGIISKSFIFSGLIVALAACGSSTSVRTKTTSTTAGPLPSLIPPSNGNGNSGNTSSGSSPAYTFSPHGVGYTEVHFTVSARHVLKAKFSPGIQDTNVQGTGFAPQYSKLGVYVKVGDTEFATPLLNNGLSGSAQTSQLIDLSSAIDDQCASTDLNCRNSVDVIVYKPNYDYWCYNYPNGYWNQNNHWIDPNSYCPYTQAESTHPWNGTLRVQTDDTQAI